MIPAVVTAIVFVLGFGQPVPSLDADAITVLHDVRDDLPFTGDAAMVVLLEHLASWPLASSDRVQPEATIDDCFVSPESVRGSVVQSQGVVRSIQLTAFPGVGNVIVTLLRTESDAFVAVVSPPVTGDVPTIEGRRVEAVGRFLKTAHLDVRPMSAQTFRTEFVVVCVGPLPGATSADTSPAAWRLAPILGVLVLCVALVMVRILVRSGQARRVSVPSRPMTALADADLPDQPEDALAELRRRHEQDTNKRT